MLLEIDRIFEPISYKEFVDNFLLLNRPCIFSKWISSSWNCIKDWVMDGKPNYFFLQKHFGKAMVPVMDTSLDVAYNKAVVRQMFFKEFLNLLENQSSECPYLKDWHFTRCFTNYCAYETPTYLMDDWLNEFWQKESDDYKFVYIGPKHSWTGFHGDVLNSYSWSANICGRKLWYLFKPGEELKIGKDINDIRKLIPHHLTRDNECLVQPTEQSAAAYAIETGLDLMVVKQEEGEILFVPSGWFHQVHNLEITISVNHNWLNGYNISDSWQYLQRRLSQVEQEICEHRDMPDFHMHCQLILRADTSFNYVDFFNFLNFIAKTRTDKLEAYLNGRGSSCNQNEIGGCCFDLSRIEEVVASMTQNESVKLITSEDGICLHSSTTRLSIHIKHILHRISYVT